MRTALRALWRVRRLRVALCGVIFFSALLDLPAHAAAPAAQAILLLTRRPRYGVRDALRFMLAAIFSAQMILLLRAPCDMRLLFRGSC